MFFNAVEVDGVVCSFLFRSRMQLIFVRVIDLSCDLSSGGCCCSDRVETEAGRDRLESTLPGIYAHLNDRERKSKSRRNRARKCKETESGIGG